MCVYVWVSVVGDMYRLCAGCVIAYTWIGSLVLGKSRDPMEIFHCLVILYVEFGLQECYEYQEGGGGGGGGGILYVEAK